MQENVTGIVVSVAFFEHVHQQSEHSMHGDQADTDTVEH